MGENVELCNSIGGYLARFDNVREYYRLSRYVQSKLICLCRVLDGIRKYILGIYACLYFGPLTCSTYIKQSSVDSVIYILPSTAFFVSF